MNDSQIFAYTSKPILHFSHIIYCNSDRDKGIWQRHISRCKHEPNSRCRPGRPVTIIKTSLTVPPREWEQTFGLVTSPEAQSLQVCGTNSRKTNSIAHHAIGPSISFFSLPNYRGSVMGHRVGDPY
ncbi:hypothetical protein OUZ56_030786 [Daphnia magna]|uniref:Uncharacterized protein n=1 Tax=Daphnia magna TaxID=35525 RepID=A0ABQ9ZSB4_9CRUS|nr:hypothetical protein OUZ56_030786 [Daphnia magna]